jgi:branched-subunit amino acid aminotransferase/4-amino-4-deoxychorismate lyase
VEAVDEKGVQRVCWIDGRLAPLDRPVVRADDSAFSEGRGCFTTLRVVGGRSRFADRHARRLQHSARELRIGEIDPAHLLRAFEELAKAAFADGDGVLRFQVSRDGEQRLHVVGLPRAAGAERSQWSAIVAPFAHEGPTPYGGQKVSSRLLHALASEAAREAGADEAVLFDAAGRLVEGSRSNLLVSTAVGALSTPPLERGAVDGIARQVVLERIPEVAEVDVSRAQLSAAREIIAVNAVRGARPITELDGRPVAEGRAGPWARRLSSALESD